MYDKAMYHVWSWSAHKHHLIVRSDFFAGWELECATGALVLYYYGTQYFRNSTLSALLARWYTNIGTRSTSGTIVEQTDTTGDVFSMFVLSRIFMPVVATSNDISILALLSLFYDSSSTTTSSKSSS
jgi:hypothetical protein